MTDIYPKSELVMEYLSSYAKHFGLLRCIKFGHRVVAIEFVGVEAAEMRAWEMWSENGEAFGKHRGEWHLTVQKSGQEHTEVCTILYIDNLYCTMVTSNKKNKNKKICSHLSEFRELVLLFGPS